MTYDLVFYHEAHEEHEGGFAAEKL